MAKKKTSPKKSEEEVLAANWEAILRLNKDLRDASRILGQSEVRYFTDFYYQVQHFRIQSSSQIRNSENDEPNAVLSWMETNLKVMENDIKKALEDFAKSFKVGQWLLSVYGIGPVIAAGLLAHIDIRKAKTMGHICRFAGLDPTVTWNKGQKRPWNARLKVLCYKAGESFVKFRNQKNKDGSSKDWYGKYYDIRKEYEVARNERGENKQLAETILKTKNFSRDTSAKSALEQGKIPDGQIHARCRRYAVKMFLSHVHHVMFEDYFDQTAPMPYSFAQEPQIDHRHYIPPPNWPMKIVEGEARNLKDLVGTMEELWEEERAKDEKKSKKGKEK